MNQLVDSLNDIAWEYSRNEEGHIIIKDYNSYDVNERND